MNLFFKNQVEIEDTYIITVKGNESSERYSKECQESCKKVGQSFKVWDAYNGLNGTIIPPEQSKDDSFMNMLKVTDHYLTRGEVACALSHISLWSHCAQIDKPIIILEHDAVMLKKFTTLNAYNSIVYLGGIEWVEKGWPIMPIPPHASEGPNYHFICRAHAYAIDPIIAKNMLAHVLKFGIQAPLDIIMRVDLFNVSHQGLYAYDKNYARDEQTTTIKARSTEGRTTRRNDKLEH
jgi:Glycosyltransferase family 25 (LPS biosynthesis protein)